MPGLRNFFEVKIETYSRNHLGRVISYNSTYCWGLYKPYYPPNINLFQIICRHESFQLRPQPGPQQEPTRVFSLKQQWTKPSWHRFVVSIKDGSQKFPIIFFVNLFGNSCFIAVSMWNYIKTKHMLTVHLGDKSISIADAVRFLATASLKTLTGATGFVRGCHCLEG